MFVKKNVLLMLILVPFLINAQGISDALRLSENGIGAGARALAMGNSYTALSDDYSAMLFNPAGLGLVKRFELSAGFTHNAYNNDATLFGNTTNNERNQTNFDQIGFVYPLPTIQGSLVFGFGYNKIIDFNKTIKYSGFNNGNNSMIQDLTLKGDDIPFDLGLSYPVYENNGDYAYDETKINGKLNQYSDIIQTGSINQYTFSGSLEAARNLFVGISLNVLGGTFKQTKNYFEDDTKDIYGSDFQTNPNDNTTKNFTTFNLQDEISWDISGYNLKLGLLYLTDTNLRFGMTIKIPTTYTIKEDYYYDAYALFGTHEHLIPNPGSSAIEYEITTPLEFSFGTVYTFNKNLILSGQFTFIDYSQAEFTSGLEKSRDKININIQNSLATVFNYNLGAEYNFVPSNIRVRVGYMCNPSAYRTDDGSEYSKKYFTCGLGYLLEQAIAIDLAYVHGWWSDYGDSYSTGGSTYTQDITYDKMMMTISYRF
ncbi:MAG: outer membrane protein transport protein [bacterium]